MRLTLTVAGDEIVADFAGSNPQVPGVVNSTLATTGAGVLVAVKATLDPEGPVNHGTFRPIRLKAPEASIVDVKLDAPAGAHGEVRKRAVSVMLGALAQVIPDLVSGDLCGTSFPNAIGGRDERRRRDYVYYEAPAGGNGGFRGGDGSNAWGNIDFGNVRTIQSAETLEAGMPLRIERSELRPDSGGEGHGRGGLGMRREVHVLYGEAPVLRAERPGGAAAVRRGAGAPGGAGEGVGASATAARREFPTPGKVTGHPVSAGDTVVMQSAGGGGFGDPLERDPERVRQDVRAGYVSAERARDGYGVVLGADGAVDAAATAARRAELAAEVRRLPVRADERDPYEGVRGKHRTLRLGPAFAAELGVAAGDLVELWGRHPAPLRAWVKIDGAASVPEIALDGLGRRILGVAPGDAVELRALAMPPVPGGLAS